MTTTFAEIPLSKIRTPYKIRAVDPVHVGRLAESIQARGLETPIVVHETGKPGEYELGPGRHRLEAFIKLKRDTIPAVVRPAASVLEITAEQVAENLERKDLTPLEEAELCASMLERTKGDQAQAASLMGRPLRWVQNRAALAALHPKVREYIAAGQIPLGHAQLIARVADPTTQVTIAQSSRAGRPNRFGSGHEERPATTREVEALVEQEGNNLAIAGWKLTVPFGKEQPKVACAGCPHNSANRGDLFAEGAEPKKPTCLLSSCFAERRNLTSLGARKAANWISKEGLPMTPANAEKAVVARDVLFVDPSSVKTYYQGPAAKKKPGKQRAGEVDVEKAEKPKAPTAKELLTRAIEDWKRKADDLVEGATKGKPLVHAFLQLVEDTKAFPERWGNRGDPKKQQALRPLFAKVGNLTADDLMAAARLVDARYNQRLPDLPDDLVAVLAKALDVKLPALPTLAEFEAKVKADAEAAAKAAAKAKAAKPATKPAAKKKAKKKATKR